MRGRTEKAGKGGVLGGSSEEGGGRNLKPPKLSAKSSSTEMSVTLFMVLVSTLISKSLTFKCYHMFIPGRCF